MTILAQKKRLTYRIYKLPFMNRRTAFMLRIMTIQMNKAQVFK